MGRVMPTEKEFELRENEVMHTPSGATWTAYPGVARGDATLIEHAATTLISRGGEGK